jgi:hypothetical protein
VCCCACVAEEASTPDLNKYKGYNPLLIPLILSWERQFVKYQRHLKAIFYKAPCGRRLRSIEELDRYLLLTNSILAIDLFSFDADVEISVEYVPVKVCIVLYCFYGNKFRVCGTPDCCLLIVSCYNVRCCMTLAVYL